MVCSTHMHLRGTATQQINEGRVEWHDGISQMHTVLLMLFLTTKPVSQANFCLYLYELLPVKALKWENTD